DTEGPNLTSVYASTPQTIELRFDERLDAILMENPGSYTIQPALGVDAAVLVDPSTVQLSLTSPMQAGIVYRLYPFDGYDCLGNSKHHADTVQFGLIVDAQPGDVYIN